MGNRKDPGSEPRNPDLRVTVEGVEIALFDRTCDWCGKDFRTQWPTSKACSEECKKERERRRARNRFKRFQERRKRREGK